MKLKPLIIMARQGHRGIIIGFIGLVSCALSAALAENRPQRIVSINLCTDQYLLALASPGQILALSPYARDRQISFYAGRASQFANVADDAESVLALRPSLVLASVYNRAETLKRLKRAGIRVVTIEDATEFGAVRRQMLEVGRLLGQEDQAKALANEFDTALAATAGRWSKAALTALYIERGGYTSGAAGLIHRLLRHVGLRSALAGRGITGSRFLDLETVLAVQPDRLVVAGLATKGDQGAAMLEHRALARLFPAEKRLALPVRETVCPGPSLITALKTLGDPAP